jgi:predicted nucleic acid-binding protein
MRKIVPIRVLPVVPTVCDRAARIRAQYGFEPLDDLHLAAAVERGCTRFLGNDAKLKLLAGICWGE